MEAASRKMTERKDLTEEFEDPYSYYELDEAYYKFGSFANPCTLQFQCLLFIVGHLDQFPVTILALLPTTLRRELLLLLPAVDVCKLEETPVITDLPMEEIWETLYKSNVDSKHEYIVARPKKDVYFQKILSSLDSRPKNQFLKSPRSLLKFPHRLILDLLYGINDKQLTECFKNSKIRGSFHDLLRCPLRCSPYSPTRYYHHFTDPRYAHPLFKMPELIKVLVDECHISFRSLEIDEKFYNAPCYCEIESFEVPYSSYLQRLFGSIETLNLYSNRENYYGRTKHILDDINSILDFHKELKKLTVSFSNFSDFGHLFEKPCFRELNIQHTGLSFDELCDIVYRFHTSPYPVTLCLKAVGCIHYSSSTSLSPPVQQDGNEYSKCLILEFVNLPFQVLPPIPHLKKLVLVSNKWQMFTKLETIQAEVVDLTTFISTEEVDGLCKLFDIVTTKEWQLYIQFENNLNSRLKDLIDAITKLHNISQLKFSFNRFFTPRELIYDVIFNRLHEYLSRMQIEFRDCSFDDTNIKEIYDSWKKCGAIKMKKLFFTGHLRYTRNSDYFLSEMQILF